MTKVMFANGDSWTFGSEIGGPEVLAAPGEKGYGMANRFKKDKACYDKENDYYRIPRTWPHLLAEKLGSSYVNLAVPARSNDTIYASTIAWIFENYINRGKDTSDLTVIIGWSSPERRNVLIEDLDGTLLKYTFWPSMMEDTFYRESVAKKFFKFYVQHLWTERESITRFVEQNFNLHMFLKNYGIKHHFFNSFYVPNRKIARLDEWQDIDIEEVINGWRTQKVDGWNDMIFSDAQEIDRVSNMWKNIPDETFLLKRQNESFKGYIDANVPANIRMVNMHPSPESHEAWAEYIKDMVK